MWYQHLIEDCRAILVETAFTARWAIIEGYHSLGKRILEDYDKVKRLRMPDSSLVQRVGLSLGKKRTTIYLAIQFARKFPDLNMLPEGKNVSWRVICQKYLPEPKEEKNILEPIEGQHEVIVIDSPWPYGTEYDAETRRVASPYRELSLEQLYEYQLPIAPNCVLWLWTTHKFLRDALELMEHWGFDYKLTLAWDKEKLGMGVWLRCQVEFCLLGIRGSPEWELSNERDIIREARRQHSRKPESFYEMVERICPTKFPRADIC